MYKLINLLFNLKFISFWIKQKVGLHFIFELDEVRRSKLLICSIIIPEINFVVEEIHLFLQICISLRASLRGPKQTTPWGKSLRLATTSLKSVHGCISDYVKRPQIG